MPLGEIKQITLSRDEVRRLEYLALLRYPQEALILRHLSKNDFRAWLYLINPRDALLFANSSEGHGIMHYQKSKSWYHDLRDWTWRKFHGNC